MISVILVTHNSVAVLPDCMRGLERSANASDLEVILVDNASGDGTSEWIERYAAQKEGPFFSLQVRLLDENLGYAYANNRGLEMARGEVMLLLNPDTVVEPGAIAVCLGRLEQDADIGVVGCRLELPDGRIDRACRRSFPTLWNSFSRLSGLSLLFPRSRLFAGYNLTYLDERANGPVDAVSGAFLMLRREAYEQVGGLDEDYFLYGEDLDWCYRIKQSGFGVWYEGSVTTLHVKGANGGKRSAVSLRHFYRTMWIYFEKHHAGKYPRFVSRLVSLAADGLFAAHLAVRRVKGML